MTRSRSSSKIDRLERWNGYRVTPNWLVMLDHVVTGGITLVLWSYAFMSWYNSLSWRLLSRLCDGQRCQWVSTCKVAMIRIIIIEFGRIRNTNIARMVIIMPGKDPVSSFLKTFRSALEFLIFSIDFCMFYACHNYYKSRRMPMHMIHVQSTCRIGQYTSLITSHAECALNINNSRNEKYTTGFLGWNN